MTSELANELIVQEMRDILKLMRTFPDAITPESLGLMLGQLALNSFTYGCAIGNSDGYNIGRYQGAKEYSLN